MAKNEGARIQPGDLAEAVGLLTRLPVVSDHTRGARASWAWPLAGAIVGFLGALGAMVALWLGLSGGIAAGVALVVQIVATGALHEDGLADCADGFWGGTDRETRLKIMADSRIGSYGVITLVLSLMFRWTLLSLLFSTGAVFGPLIAVAALSRVVPVGLMVVLEPVRPGGLAATVGRPAPETLIMAGATGLLIALLFTGFVALAAALIAAGLGWAVLALARARIGGQTGDVLGASQQVAEIGMLMGLVVLIG